LWQAPAQRVFNVSDDTDLKMGDYFDLAADTFDLPRPQRMAREGAEKHVSLMVLSFMNESRRLLNRRLKDELRLLLRYPTVQAGWGQAAAPPIVL